MRYPQILVTFRCWIITHASQSWNRFNHFFNALMSNDNKIIELLVYNCHFSSTPLGLNRKSMNINNCYKCKEFEEAHGALLLSLLNVRWRNWSVLQFQKDEIELILTFHGDVSFNVWISTFPGPMVLYEWMIIVVFIFVHINMFIFLSILGPSESEWTIESNWIELLFFFSAFSLVKIMPYLCEEHIISKTEKQLTSTRLAQRKFDMALFRYQ